MSWLVTNLIAAVLLPPFSLFILLGLSLYFLNRQRIKLGKWLLFITIVLGWLCSSWYVVLHGMQWLERHTKPLNPTEQAEVIVILGGGTYYAAPEYENQDTVKYTTLERLRYGAKLQRQTAKPILVTGGSPADNVSSEAAQMAQVLQQEFQVAVQWQEGKSDNTFENAMFSKKILQPAGIKRIYLVTHAWHMPRAARIFREAGFEVIEAPTAFTTNFRITALSFVPDANALQKSKWLIHELIGIVWYEIRLWFA